MQVEEHRPITCILCCFRLFSYGKQEQDSHNRLWNHLEQLLCTSSDGDVVLYDQKPQVRRRVQLTSSSPNTSQKAYLEVSYPSLFTKSFNTSGLDSRGSHFFPIVCTRLYIKSCDLICRRRTFRSCCDGYRNLQKCGCNSLVYQKNLDALTSNPNSMNCAVCDCSHRSQVVRLLLPGLMKLHLLCLTHLAVSPSDL